MHKGAIMFGVGLLLTLVVIALLLYFLVGKSTFNSGFKNGFKDLSNMDPLTRLYVKNRYLRDMYGTQLNVDSGETMRTYMEFLNNPGKNTPTVIYESVTEIVEFMNTADLYGHTTDTDKLQVYIRSLDALLTDFFNSKYITAERLNGVNERDNRLLDEYTTSSLDASFVDFLNAVAPNRDEHDIREQQMLAMQVQDYDISHYVEQLETAKEIVGEVKTVKEAYDEAGKRNRLEFRPYPGSTNPRVIAEDDPYEYDKFDSTKDYNIPKPGILNGQAHDFPTFTGPWRSNRNAYNFNGF